MLYQPESPCTTGAWSASKPAALATSRKLLKPSAFVPLAEETDLITPIGRWVLEEACRQAKRWEEASPPAATMEVNLSARQLARRGLAQTVEEALRRTDLAAHALALDITETVLIGASEHNAQALEALKKMGIRLYLDDFGTGYSSLVPGSCLWTA